MSEELAALDREWAELAGFRVETFVKEYEDGGWDWVTRTYSPTGGYYYGGPPRYSQGAAACFAPKGPWEWMVQNHLWPHVSTEPGEGSEFRFEVSTDPPPGEGVFVVADGHSLFEAITRCAIEARKKLEAKDE